MALDFKLPHTVIGPGDVARLKRDLETYDDQMHQATLRAKSGEKSAEPQASRLITEIATANGCDMQQADDRQQLLAALTKLLETAPTVTISFAVDPSAAFMSKLAQWFRVNVHPMLLLRIGLQPNIAAGCTVRTPSKLYDFSMRSKFAMQRGLLIKRLHAGAQSSVTIQAPTVEAAQ